MRSSNFPSCEETYERDRVDSFHGEIKTPMRSSVYLRKRHQKMKIGHLQLLFLVLQDLPYHSDNKIISLFIQKNKLKKAVWVPENFEFIKFTRRPHKTITPRLEWCCWWCQWQSDQLGGG